MSYQVLARKWRPRTFADMVGQQHVLRALTNALDADRMHHAFLFTGTRGVGKTTVARILAKCLNCESGPSATPCGTCAACVEVDEGRFLDLIEVDAASRARVDETRELLDNVQYAPARGRYKVYLIDEVHMFSKHGFNALLKTLEEPPPHVKFLLATTDPQRLPITVLSRCLQFNLQRLDNEHIEGQLAKIAGAEDIEHDAPALTLLARAADGSMRDALSLLDQAIAYGGGALSESDVQAMLGTVERRHLVALLEGLAGQDAASVLAAIEALGRAVPDFDAVLGELAAALSRIAVLQMVPNPPRDDLDDEAWAPFVGRFEAEALQLYYQIALMGRRDLPLAPSPRIGCEMALLRMLAFAPGDAGGGVPGAPIAAADGGSTPGVTPGSASSPAGGVHPSAAPRGADPLPPVSPDEEGDLAPSLGTDPGASAWKCAAEGSSPSKLDALRCAPPDHRESGPGPELPRPRGEDVGVPSAPSPAAPAWAADPPPPSAESAVSSDPPSVSPPRAGVLASLEPSDWPVVVRQLAVTGVTRELVLNTALIDADATRLRLGVDPRHRALLAQAAKAQIETAIGEHFGGTVAVAFELTDAPLHTPAKVRQVEEEAALSAAKDAIEGDPNVRAILERFGGRVEAGSIRPRARP